MLMGPRHQEDSMKFAILAAIAVSVTFVHAQEVEKKNTDRLQPTQGEEQIAPGKTERVKAAKEEKKRFGAKGSPGKMVEARPSGMSKQFGMSKQYRLNEVLKDCAADAKARLKERQDVEDAQGTQCLS